MNTDQKPERPKVAELWELAKDQGMNVIVVTTFERFSRDPVRAAAIRNKLQPIIVEQTSSNLN